MEPIFVLVHGAWHGAWCFEQVTPPLVRAGARVVARDLPAHGMDARFPAAYLQRPLDLPGFAAEPAPSAGVTPDDYATHVINEVKALAERAPDVPIVLVGHSMGGVTVSRVAEAVPHLVSRVVYLAAFMLVGRSPLDIVGTPEFAGSLLPPLFLADPAQVGAMRIDFGSTDPDYVARTKAAFAGDVPDERWTSVSYLLTPDEPIGPVVTPVTVTRERWGTVPRTYILCTEDKVIPPAAQRRFIEEADEFAPDGATEVRELNTGHSPFLSAPGPVADILLDS
jgi:pimeloyl-ACP methyl ester carboxylesterase